MNTVTKVQLDLQRPIPLEVLAEPKIGAIVLSLF